MSGFQVRQLFCPENPTCSYLLWDTVTGDAALIDPVREMVGRDVRLVGDLGLHLRFTLETHLHTDHITGAGLLREHLDSLVLMHENYASKYADVLLRHGDRIPLGNGRITVLHTPGHTNSDVCYLIPGMVFTGDTLLIRGCGQPDFTTGDPGTLYDSIYRELFTLPDDTIVYPGHDYNGLSSSTIGEEKRYNPRLGMRVTRERFIATMNNLHRESPWTFRDAVPGNLRCGIPGSGVTAVSH